jgi:2-keto-4-pentenoate hydratase/2-oxohepta-3-ene-1,7-dioic acid hydratase in catechol pathway
MKPRGYLKPGQTVRIQIESIGTLTNPVIAEPEVR